MSMAALLKRHNSSRSPLGETELETVEMVLEYLMAQATVSWPSILKGGDAQLSFYLAPELLHIYVILRELQASDHADSAARTLVEQEYAKQELLPLGFVSRLSPEQQQARTRLLTQAGKHQHCKDAVALLFSIQTHLEGSKHQFAQFTPEAVCVAVLLAVQILPESTELFRNVPTPSVQKELL